MHMSDIASTGKMTEAQMKKQEADWRAEADLRTLIEAAKIRKDSGRLKLALEKKKGMLADLETIKAIT